MNNALSVLENALDPRTSTLLPQTTVNFEGGSATYSGTIDANYLWSITSIGSVRSPTGALSNVRRTLKRTVQILGLNQTANGIAWSRFYQDSNAIVPHDRRRQLARAGLDARQPLPRERRHDHRLDHDRRHRRERHHRRPRHDAGGARSDRSVRLDELDERLHEQQRLRDQRDLGQLDRRHALRDRVRLLRPVERDHPRHPGQRDSQGDRGELDPGSDRPAPEGGHRGRVEQGDRRDLEHLQRHAELRDDVRSLGHDLDRVGHQQRELRPEVHREGGRDRDHGERRLHHDHGDVLERHERHRHLRVADRRGQRQRDVQVQRQRGPHAVLQRRQGLRVEHLERRQEPDHAADRLHLLVVALRSPARSTRARRRPERLRPSTTTRARPARRTTASRSTAR